MDSLLPLLFAPAFVLADVPMSWLELLAVALGLAMVVCNIRAIHWGWPLAALSAALYLLLFWQGALYGQALLQLVFITLSLWGWRQWLRGSRNLPSAGIGWMSLQARCCALAGCALLWGLIGWALDRLTDSPLPWQDAFPTALSLVAQVLLARKRIENWWLWLVVNAASVLLFAQQALWPTAGLYLVFGALSVAGWRAWSRLAPASATGAGR